MHYWNFLPAKTVPPRGKSRIMERMSYLSKNPKLGVTLLVRITNWQEALQVSTNNNQHNSIALWTPTMSVAFSLQSFLTNALTPTRKPNRSRKTLIPVNTIPISRCGYQPNEPKDSPRYLFNYLLTHIFSINLLYSSNYFDLGIFWNKEYLVLGLNLQESWEPVC